MTLVSQIISDAFRESNLIAAGASPTATESAEALTLLNRVVTSLYSTEAGEQLSDLPYGEENIDTPELVFSNFDDFDDEYIPHNTRLILNLSEAKTVNLHPTPQDGDRFAVIDASGNLATTGLTINGNGRLIEGSLNTTLSTNGQSRSWFYRADLSDWKTVTDLIETDESPFPQEFDDLLVIRLALRINPRHGRQIDGQSIERHSDLTKKFKSRYKQSIQKSSELGLLRLTSDTLTYGSTDSFNRGRPW